MGNALTELAKETVQVQKGAVLMVEGETGQCAYFVVKGRLLVEKELEGKKVVLGEIGAKDIVGELAILDNTPRSASVSALEDTVLIVLDRERIRTIIRRSPEIAEVIMKLICHKLRQNHALLNKMSDIQSPQCWLRICSLLRLCARVEATPDQLCLTFLENLQLLNLVSIQRMSIILQRLKEVNLIELDGKRITAVDSNRLVQFILFAKEEYSNEEIAQPTSIRLFLSVRILLNKCQQMMQGKGFVNLNKNDVSSILMENKLWEELHPRLQHHRAEQVVAQLLEETVLGQDPEAGEDSVQIILDHLMSYPEPTQDLNDYNLMKEVFLRPDNR